MFVSCTLKKPLSPFYRFAEKWPLVIILRGSLFFFTPAISQPCNNGDYSINGMLKLLCYLRNPEKKVFCVQMELSILATEHHLTYFVKRYCIVWTLPTSKFRIGHVSEHYRQIRCTVSGFIHTYIHYTIIYTRRYICHTPLFC